MAVGEITNVIPASQLPPMSESELLANVTFVVVDGNGVLKQILRPSLFSAISSLVAKGDKGDKGDTGDRGVKGDKGDVGNTGSKGDTGATGSTGATGRQGIQGFNGWSPVYSIVSRGTTDQVIQVVNWTNPNPSATGKPSFPVYITPTGFSTNVADAINIKGAKGDKGDQGIQGLNGSAGSSGTNGFNGYSPSINLEENAGKYYFYLNSWQGGSGTPPTEIGYISLDGVTDDPVVGSDILSLLSVDFSAVTNKPTTLSGYGITNAYTKAEVDTALSTKVTTTDLASVAISGSYNDLTSKPSLPISFYSGAGSPESSQIANIPSIYVDTNNGNVYSKTTNGGTTGWKQVTLT